VQRMPPCGLAGNTTGGAAVSCTALMHTTPSSNQGRLGLPPKAAPAEGRPESADAPMHQSREAHHPARPLHSPEGAYSPRRSNHGRPCVRRPGNPPATALTNRAVDRKPRPGRHDPSAGRERGHGTHKPIGQGCAQLPLCDQPDSSQTGYSTAKVAAQQAISPSTASQPFASHSNAEVVSYNCSGRRPTSVCAGQSLCGAPRRNRTGDPILTMEPPGTAVRMIVLPGRARP